MKVVICLVLLTFICLGDVFTLNLKRKHKRANKNKSHKNKQNLYSYQGGVQSTVVGSQLIPTDTSQVINTPNGLATPSSTGVYVSGGQVYSSGASSIPYGYGYSFN